VCAIAIALRQPGQNRYCISFHADIFFFSFEKFSWRAFQPL
jgi:hypothetical protein